MDASQLISTSSTLLFIAFFLYILASIVFIISITGKKWANRDVAAHTARWGRLGFIITIIGLLFQIGYLGFRWAGQGHIPNSNMFEFMTLLGMMTVVGFVVIYLIYKASALGAFVMPLAVTILGWAAVFDQTPQPLVPSLQSNWLKIHVTTVSLAEGLLAVGFAAGLMYIIRTVNQSVSTRETKVLELFLAVVLMLVGFIALSITFKSLDYEVTFEYMNEKDKLQEISYGFPAIAGPYEGKLLSEERMKPLISTPSWMKGVDAPRKFNTMLWSILSGALLYVLLRFVILRKRLGAVMQPWLSDLKPAMLDEISYRAIAIGFPLFTLGALIFAMIWAEQAWGRFWGWDPKEVWALITWIFYAVYLHLRLSIGWHGAKSSWLAVGGFIVIMFNLVFVNLIIAGLHSYASGG
jgi:ABC-type transport system involved in cytochrome c biogenesis permease subunit